MRISSICIRDSAPKMSVFIQKLNPITGSNDWIVQNEDYDYHQEVARSSFADMLHDTERNQLYEKAIKSAIAKIHSSGREARVLDIGTGTGLLSMMAVRNGANHVTACEAFKPMSACALKIIKRNKLNDKIKVIPKRSTELTVGRSGDLEQRCNILVTEVFDTELIGEGALSTFDHAHKFLLEKNCVVVPHSATIFAQVVDSPLVQNWNKMAEFPPTTNNSQPIKIPNKIKECSGSAAVHDLQLNQLNLDSFKTIVSPTPVFRFDWSGKTPFILERSTISSAKCVNSGNAHAVFMWWDLQMDVDNKIVLSCAPYWAHPTKSGAKFELPWRDHWMQAIYYLPKELRVEQNQEVHLISCHDEYSLWFNLKSELRIVDSDYIKPICECGLHVAFSRTRLGQINDSNRNGKYLKLFEKHINQRSTILVISDGFYLSLLASRMAIKVYYIESNYLSRKILCDFIKFNNLNNVEVFENFTELISTQNINKIDLVIGEPYFTSSILPWDNLLIIYLIKAAKNFLLESCKIFPKTALIKGVAVEFSDLYKIRAPLGTCEGFFMNDFDDLINESSNISDDNVEAQPLWEYPSIALSHVFQIATINTTDLPEHALESKGVFEIDISHGGCNGIALWVEWIYDDSIPNSSISSGPISELQIGKPVKWDIHTRQAVCLFPKKCISHIDYSFKFDFNEGNISFKCS